MSKHSPAPWTWQDGFVDIRDKYADCRLLAADGSEVLPIRMDHHDPIWDVDPGITDDGDESEPVIKPSPEDRALLAAAPDLLAALEGLALANHHGYSASTADRLGLTAEFLSGGVPSLGRALWKRANAAIAKATT